MLALLLLSSSSAFAIDTGDGSDGVCTDATFISAKRTYQCISLTITGPIVLFKAVDGAQVVIKVQDDINITGTGSFDLSGGNGADGDGSNHDGGKAGAGGGAGGNSVVGADGLNGSGAGSSYGAFGLYVADAAGSYGGGGGGGSFRTKAAGEPEDGFDSGGLATSKGANGSTFMTSGSMFDTSFTGGSGGAGGGGGTNLGADLSGSSGGGGGGAIHLVAGGNINIDGSIISNGGRGGGNATQFSGGGGGGSGGAIWIQAANELTVSGTITAIGGSGGDTDYGTGLGSAHGGDGGRGAIRLDDSDGVVVPTGTVDAGFYQGVFIPTTSNVLSRQYASGVSCASVALDDHSKPFNNLINLVVGLGIAGLAYFVVSKKSKV